MCLRPTLAETHHEVVSGELDLTTGDDEVTTVSTHDSPLPGARRTPCAAQRPGSDSMLLVVLLDPPTVRPTQEVS